MLNEKISKTINLNQNRLICNHYFPESYFDMCCNGHTHVCDIK